jgi:hypothetical protein
MDASTDIRSVIKFTQERILKDILALIPKEKRYEAQVLIDQFWQSNLAIAAMTPSADTRYASCPHVIDAIKLYLRDVDRPAPRTEIMSEVVKRGFRPGDNADSTAGNVNRAIYSYQKGRASHKKEIKEINGLVGLYECPESRFPSATDKSEITSVE